MPLVYSRSQEAVRLLKEATEKEKEIAYRWLRLSPYRPLGITQIPEEFLRHLERSSPYWVTRKALEVPAIATVDDIQSQVRGRQAGKSSCIYLDQESGWASPLSLDFSPCLAYARNMAEEDIPRALIELDMPGFTAISAHLCTAYTGDPKKKWWQVRGHNDLKVDYLTLEKSKRILLTRIGAK